MTAAGASVGAGRRGRSNGNGWDYHAAPVPHLEEVIETDEVRSAWWYTTLGWIGVAFFVYLLICGVNVMSRGFQGLGADTAHALFGFTTNPLVGLCVGLLATVIVQSSSTTTALTVAAVGSGALTIGGAIPVILGSNLGTTVTCTLVAVGFVGAREDFRRALAASTVHDFYNLIALAIFFPLELIFHPLERMSAWLASGYYGVSWIPDPSDFNLLRTITNPAVNGVRHVTALVGDQTLAAAIMILVGVVLIFVAIRYVGKLLRTLMVGRARAVLIRVVGGNKYIAMLAGALATAFGTQSSTVTQSIVVPFAGTGVLSTKQVYPVTVGANLGTTVTALLTAFAVSGAFAEIGLQAAFVHLLYNVLSAIVIFIIPILRPLPPFLAGRFAGVAVGHRWLIVTWIVGLFLLLPATIVGVYALS